MKQKRIEEWEDLEKNWEDDNNQFLKQETQEETRGNDLKQQRHLDQSSERPKKDGKKLEKKTSEDKQHRHCNT